MPHKASDIAKTFVSLTNPELGDYLSNLKLQKLLYYAQGLHLAMYHSALFEEQIYAWQHGPVVPSVYHEFKEFQGAINNPPNWSNDYLTERELEFLKEVYEVFGQFSAFKLVEMTHNEPPWKSTTINSEITHPKLKRYFLTQVNSDDEAN